MPDFPKADSTSAFGAADTKPKASAEELKYWWHRNTIGPRFHPYIVKRVREERTDEGLRNFYFQLVRMEAWKEPGDETPLKTFHVELTSQYQICWPDLPSTAPLATDDKPYGFLMLSERWEANANVGLRAGLSVTSLRETGNKWPIAATPRALLRSLSEDKALDDMPVLDALNHILKALR
ncbi:hypothetical protein ACN469_35540 [Corallococcus terminator]